MVNLTTGLSLYLTMAYNFGLSKLECKICFLCILILAVNVSKPSPCVAGRLVPDSDDLFIYSIIHAQYPDIVYCTSTASYMNIFIIL